MVLLLQNATAMKSNAMRPPRPAEDERILIIESNASKSLMIRRSEIKEKKYNEYSLSSPISNADKDPSQPDTSDGGESQPLNDTSEDSGSLYADSDDDSASGVSLGTSISSKSRGKSKRYRSSFSSHSKNCRSRKIKYHTERSHYKSRDGAGGLRELSAVDSLVNAYLGGKAEADGDKGFDYTELVTQWLQAEKLC